MAVTFELPQEIEQSLRRDIGDLGQAAKEALLAGLYRRGRLTHRLFAEALGVSRFEADAVLKRHGAWLDLTAEDVAREADGLRELRAGHGDRS